MIAVEGDSAFGFSGMEIETICRYNLPVVRRRLQQQRRLQRKRHQSARRRRAPPVFVKDARYDKMMEAFGGVGVHAKTPDELRKGIDEALASRRPTLINAVIDETAGTESGRITSLNPTAAKKK